MQVKVKNLLVDQVSFFFVQKCMILGGTEGGWQCWMNDGVHSPT